MKGYEVWDRVSPQTVILIYESSHSFWVDYGQPLSMIEAERVWWLKSSPWPENLLSLELQECGQIFSQMREIWLLHLDYVFVASFVTVVFGFPSFGEMNIILL